MVFGQDSGSGGPDPAEDGWLIVGLGNPGRQYERTRHNLGFMVVDLLAERASASVKRTECGSLVGLARMAGKRVELAKPQTFMNLSGEAVACLTKKEGRILDRTLVVVDDLALPFGTVRLRMKGSAGGHNGLKSIIERTGRQDFPRLRIGIMPDHPVSNTKRFVLDEFPAGSAKELKEVLERSADAAERVVEKGMDFAMSEFNG